MRFLLIKRFEKGGNLLVACSAQNFRVVETEKNSFFKKLSSTKYPLLNSFFQFSSVIASIESGKNN